MASSRSTLRLLHAVRTAPPKAVRRPPFVIPACRARPSLQTRISPSIQQSIPSRWSSSSSSSPSPSSPSSSSQSSSSSSSSSSGASGDIKPYDFASMRALSAQATDAASSSLPSSGETATVVVVDVREPGEVAATGRIPGAVNMPINSSPDGLFLTAEDFEDRFGFAKPEPSRHVVFYCKAGVRSRAAARTAVMAGFESVGEYPGSWVDWEKNGGEAEK